MSNNHAFLSPSNSERWLNCTPSAMLESSEPIQQSSTYAEEGTEAHALSELKLSFMLGKISADEYDTKFEFFRMNSKYYNAEFNDYVNDYCNEVMAIITEDYQGQELIVELEAKIDYSDIVPKGSGTSDVVIIGKNFVHVIDLKFGKGVAVNAIGNSQLRLYALGALRKYRLHGIFTDVRMTIHQPRLYDVSTDHMLVSELNNWAITYVKPRAELAIDGKGDLIPGDHCKFCKVRGKCEALGKQQLAIAQKEFENVIVKENILDPKYMTPEMLSRIMEIAPRFIDWFKEVTAYAKRAMVYENQKIPGYKIVQGSSKRIITNPDAIIQKLKTKGFEEEAYLAPAKLQGITALEKNIGKKLFNELCKDYIIKPSGNPIVVLETDKREEYSTQHLKLAGQEFDYNEET